MASFSSTQNPTPTIIIIIQVVNKTIHRFSAVICISVTPSLSFFARFSFFLPLSSSSSACTRLYDASSALNEVRPRPLLINSQAGRWSNVFKLLAQFIEQTSLFSATEPAWKSFPHGWPARLLNACIISIKAIHRCMRSRNL